MPIIQAFAGTMDIPPPQWSSQTQALEEWASQGLQSNPKVLEKLMSTWRIPINHPNKKGETILMHAAYHGCRLTVDWLLQSSADPAARDNRGSTALFAACSNQVIYIPIVESLLSAGLNVDQRGPQNFTALQLAASIGNLNLVKTLCNYRPNLAEKSTEGTASEIAQKTNHIAVYNYLLELEKKTPKRLAQENPQSQQGRVRRKASMSFSGVDAATGGNPGMLDELAAMVHAKRQEEEKEKEKPKPAPVLTKNLIGDIDEIAPPSPKKKPDPKSEKAAFKRKVSMEFDADDLEAADFSKCAYVDPKDPTRLTKFLLTYDSKLGKLYLVGNSVKAAFNQMDWQKVDNKLTVKEFKAYFKQQGLSLRRCKRLFRLFDKDRNGSISFKEFNERMQELKVVEAGVKNAEKASLVRSSSINNEKW